MQKHSGLNQQDPAVEGDVISLTEILAILWRARVLVLLLTSLFVVSGVLGALYMARYKSEGFLQFGGAIPPPNDKRTIEPEPGIELADYKRYTAAFSTSERFAKFTQQYKLTGEAGIDDLRRAIASRDGIAKLVEPVYPFTKLDAKELMELPKESRNNVIGLRISYESKAPETAQKMVGLLGRYVVDSMIYLTYSDALRFKHTEIQSKLTKLDNEIITQKERLEEYRRKEASLKQIVARYPESANQAARQVISVTEDSARFLSPVTHLMTAEVDAAIANETIIKAKRSQRQNALLLEYYDGANTLLNNVQSGEAILRGLEQVKNDTFKDKNLDDEVVKEVYNTVTMENQNAVSLYLEKTRFIAGPSLPENRLTRLSTVLLTSFLLGLLVSVTAAFGHSWWRNNRSRIR